MHEGFLKSKHGQIVQLQIKMVSSAEQNPAISEKNHKMKGS
jgi:hypothetical protein